MKLLTRAEELILLAIWRLEKDAYCVPILDQVQERNCGLITDRVRDHLAKLADRYPDKFFFADSRVHISEFRRVIIKPNRYEASAAAGMGEDPSPEEAKQAASILSQRTGRPVFMTMDKSGIIVVDREEAHPVPAVPVEGPIDIVGAGDSTTAGAVLALVSGATLPEAAAMGCLVASVTIRQLGTTGTASPQQVLDAFNRTEDLYADV